MRARDQAGDVEKLYGDGPSALGARAVVRFTPVRNAMSRARAVDLEVADSPLGINRGEPRRGGAKVSLRSSRARTRGLVREVAYPMREYQHLAAQEARSDTEYRPTLEEASVRLFRVVLFPAEGLPTRPINGSRGMMSSKEQPEGRSGQQQVSDTVSKRLAEPSTTEHRRV